MRILLTNDDGLRAPGIAALHDALLDARGELGGPIGGPELEVLVVAPLTVQSATSHGVTFREPLMTETIRVGERMRGVAIDGRPADCVKLALSSIWPERFGEGSRPDLLISGLNAGANCGINVIYSGTVAAALEGAFLGVPSIAVSLHLGRGTPLFDLAAARARRTIERLLARGLPGPHECLSVNIPRTQAVRAPGEDREPEGDDLPGAERQPAIDVSRPLSDIPDPPVRVCPMNTHGLIDHYERRVSPAGGVYYWASGGGLDFHATEPGTDVQALLDGCITVTPLRYDLTDHDALERWRRVI